MASSFGESIDSAESTLSAEPESAQDAIIRIAAALIQMRADTKTSIGSPTRIVPIDATIQFRFGDAGIGAASAFKIEFRCDVPRTCPISKEIRTTDYHAIMRAHELTGLLALYISCEPCAAKQRSASGEYCLVGVLSQEETNELEKSGAFEHARARIAKLRAELAKLTWTCAACGVAYAENDRPSDCCEAHAMNGELKCQECQRCSPCEEHARMEYY